ncbi:hypothetical protein [Flavobacterium sp. UBA7680]|uniref:hypothetical protein n=1 Tax=Flavobacterium sp. UBA7680 TaxID=1946559 RepID=UPI0025C2941D|nr:hypothetical protein [Flavobacterium sp. UBA7680]
MKCLKIIYIILFWISVCGNAFAKAAEPVSVNFTAESTFVKKMFLGTELCFLEGVQKIDYSNYHALDKIEVFHPLVTKGINRKAIPADSLDNYLLSDLYSSEWITLKSFYDTQKCEGIVKKYASRNNYLHLYQLF